MSRFRRIPAALLAALLLLTAPAGAWENDTRSDAVTAAALGEVGYTEQDNEFTKYGQWYGLSNSYWCAMFVSWAGKEAGVPAGILPRGAYCPSMVNTFQAQGRFFDSAARGGDYVPQQGDLIFYYAPDSEPEGNSVATHIGIVLYTENGRVFAIEGNALTVRHDLPPLTGEYDDSFDPPDYVTVNDYPLSSRRILGYGMPDYGDRTPLALTGFADLGNDTDRAEQFETLADLGILPGTSSHTYSPRQGLPRGAFVTALMTLYGLEGFPEETPAFADVPADSPYYPALMTARALGIFAGGDGNTASPERYVTGPEAQALLSRTLALLGLPAREFSFSDGDYVSLGGYTVRADLAAALYALLDGLGTPADYPGALRRGGRDLDWTAYTMEGVTYVPLKAVQKTYPRLKAALPEADPPVSGAVRVLPGTLPLTVREHTAEVPAFWKDGGWYIALRPTAALLGVELVWEQATGAIALSQ